MGETGEVGLVLQPHFWSSPRNVFARGPGPPRRIRPVADFPPCQNLDPGQEACRDDDPVTLFLTFELDNAM